MAGLLLASAAVVPLLGTAAASCVSARQSLDRVAAWHLAKGLAVEFAAAGAEATGGGGLSERAALDLSFTARVARLHPEVKACLSRFRVQVQSGPGGALATVTWREGSQTRVERESAGGQTP